jgi:hypothetical protein
MLPISGTLTHERLLEVVCYDPATGAFTWRQRVAKNIPAGRRAGSVAPNGFRYVRIDKQDFLAQRLAWFYMTAEWPAKKLRHRDDNRDNNAFDNLIEVGGSGKFKGQFDCSTPEGKAAYSRAHREANPELYQDRYLRRDFGISLADYLELFAHQRGVCAICRQPERSKRAGKLKQLAVDHDHETGRVRGLLCSNCNPMIGYAKDNADTLRAAAIYLDYQKLVGSDNRCVSCGHPVLSDEWLAYDEEGEVMGLLCDPCRQGNRPPRTPEAMELPDNVIVLRPNLFNEEDSA